MDLYSQYDRSLPQKFIIMAAEIIIIIFSALILFSDSINLVFITLIAGDPIRRCLLLAMNIFVFIRLSLTFFFLFQRKIPFGEVIVVPAAFGLYYIGFALLGYTAPAFLNILDVIGIVLFLAGSFFNSFSELQRHLFKQKSENKGMLYTGGLFSLSMHINFFGDILWLAGYAFVTQNIFAFTIPVLMFFFFYFSYIPPLDNHLEKKYGKQFEEYKKKTKKFVPFIL